ncbi:YoaK family protein [Planosporangium sp. 12N6]|uniref:YoaK family protein n=1 Tax=Planosporangium spinosum TaxID=3402278 RepID=UPI003CFA47AB
MGAGAGGTASGPRPDAALPERVVTRLLIVLTAASGCLDAVCVSRLGGLFASVITGNLIQLGRSITTTDARLATGAATAVGGYALGVAVGTAALGRCGAGWLRRTSVVAAVEVVLLAGVAAGWLATAAHPGRLAAPSLLATAAAAMGVQSALTVSSGGPGASTTYLTGTLTGVVRTLTVDPHRFAAGAGGGTRLAALLCGAIVGALVLRVAPSLALVPPTALVAAAVVAAALTRPRPSSTPDGGRSTT